MHEYLGVGFARDVIVFIIEQLFAQFHVIGQLSVEGETEPFMLFDVVAFERLCVTAVFQSAGGISNVSNSRSAAVFLHERLVLVAMPEAKYLVHAPRVFVRVDEMLSAWIVCGDTGGKLPAILYVL